MAKKAKQDTVIDETDIPVDEYTEAEREDAEMICDALADNRGEFAHDDADAAIEAAISFGASAEAVALALAASRAVPSMDKDTDEPLTAADIWGEAAAQIRELWSPGDSIGEESDDDEDIRDKHDFETFADEDDDEGPGDTDSDPIGFADAPEPCAGAEDGGGGGGDDALEAQAEAEAEASDELADVPADFDFDHEHDRWAADGGRH